MKARKLLSLLLALVMVFAMVIPAMADETTPETPEAYTVPADVSGKIVILHTNDTHGADVADPGKSIGTAGVAQLKKDFEAAGAKVLLLSAGDASQGTPLVNLEKGAAAIQFMNAAGYDAMSPGNHEFDWGAENFKAVAGKAEFPILAANILDESTKKTVFAANKIFELGEVKVGVFGLDTPEAATKTNPEKVAGLAFLAEDDLYACAEAQVKELKKAGCDLIVCLGHLGIDEETAATHNRSVDVCNKVEGIDLFVDGHSHTVMENGKPVAEATYPSFSNTSKTLIVSTGTKLANVGVVVWDPAAKTLTPSLVSAESYSKVDEATNKIVTDVNTQVDEALKDIIGKTEVVLNGERAPGNRTEETNLGDFTTDAILWFAKKDQGDKVVAAITNGGGIRASIPEGDISMKVMNTVYPYGNTVVTLDLTGQQILETLEAATYCTPTPIGAFPQVSGITFTIDTTKEYKNGEAYGTYFRCANPGTRVTDVTIDGKPLDLAKTYTIATNDFSAAGGDTYYAFKDAKSTMVDTGIGLDQALTDYANEVLKGTITAEQYGKPQGRITIKLSVADTFTDVKKGDWFEDAVQYAYDNKLMVGTSSTTFEPEAALTNAQTIQLLYNMEGKPAVENVLDSVKGEWYADAVSWAAAEDLTDAKDFTEADILRGDVVTLMAKYFAKDNKSIKGLFQGDENGKLNFDKTLTRAEMATLLSRIPDLKEIGTEAVSGKAAAISKYGNVGTDIKVDAFAAAGFQVGDMIKVEISGQKEALVIPYGTGYSNVDKGSALALPDTNSGTLALAINLGDFATTYGLGVKGEDKTYTITDGVTITISIAEKGGYLDEMEIRNIESKRTNTRDDYSSDEVFANFRAIKMGKIADGVLYRTSSPVNPELGRNTHADKLIEAANVKTVINLADNEETMKGYEGYADSYYATLEVLPLNMGVDMEADDSKASLKSAFEFMIANKGPYAFHCTEGKDRAGYFAMVLEALMGGTVEEITADYMLSFENYYHVEKGSEQWKKIAASNITKDLMKLAGVETEEALAKADLVKATETYLTKTIGLTAKQVTELKGVLSTPVADELPKAA